MAHHTPGLEEEVNPLHFLQRSPVISILGDPLHLDLPIEVTTLAKISKSNAFLQSFLSSVVEAINQQLRELARIDNALTLNVDVLKESEKLITSIHACPQLTAPLELVVIFGTYLAASNGADINAPGSGAEETLHDRIQKHGSDGFIDLSRFGLAAAVLRASRSLGDVFSLGIKAACAALVFAFDVDLKAHKLLAQGQEMYQRLLVPAQDFETISTVEDVRILGTLFGMAVIVEGPSSLIQKLQSKLAFELGTMSFVQPQLYLPTSTPAPSQMSDFPQSVQLLFEEIGGTRTSIGTLQETLCGCKDLSSIPLQFKRALDGAFSDLGANHVAVLGFGTGKHLLQASQGHLKSASQDKSLGTSVCDVLESLQKGNFKSVDRDIPVNLSAVKGSAAESIAIVGMSCRVPGAESVDEFWQLLLDGKDMCDKIPERLFKVEDYQSPSYKDKNTMRASNGNFLDRPGFWDPQVFGYDVDMARKLDPQGRLVMMVALEALEKAGYHHKSMSSSTPGNIGTVIGVCSEAYQQNRSHTITEDFVPALLRSNIATRTNRFFGWDGPAVTLDTACSGSLVSIESACSYLLQGKCDAVLSGGVNVLTQPQIFLGLDRGFFLSPTGQCKTLDDKGDGYSRSDAVSLVVLKRMSDAVRDGDNILATINSAATNHSGESYSITHPHFQTQRRLYRSGMLAAQIDGPHEVSYAELHGTGTAAGDFEEISGVVSTYAKSRLSAAPLIIGSVKANLGHSESCSGATSLLKALLVYRNNLVPRHIGIRSQLNKKLPDLTGIHVPIEATAVGATGSDLKDSIFTVSNFSAAAGNTSLILRGGGSLAPEAVTVPSVAAVPTIFALSGATLRSLDDNAAKLLTFLDANPVTDIAALCATLLTTRMQHVHRLSGLVSSVDDIRDIISKHEVKKVQSLKGARIALIFSGQGSQYPNMGKGLFESSPAFRHVMLQCNEWSRLLGFGDFLSAIYSTEKAPAEPSPVHYQLAIVSLEISLAAMLRGCGLNVTGVAGHSLGEYSALHVSGVLDLRDLIKLVGSRAQLMVKCCQAGASTMLAVKTVEANARRLIFEAGAKNAEIACFNSQDDLVLAGNLSDIQAIKARADTATPKIKSMILNVPYAFHSAAVEPLMDPFAAVASAARFKHPVIPIAVNSGKVVRDSGYFNGAYLVDHMRQPVRFDKAIEEMCKDDLVDICVEVGPHTTCIPMLKSIFSGKMSAPVLIPTLRKGVSAWTAIQTSMLHLSDGGAQVDWAKFFDAMGSPVSAAALASSLPTYAFDLENFWIEYKDRGLRDHLAERQVAPVKKAGRMQSSRLLVAQPKPEHSLLTTCTELRKGEPPIAKFEALVNQPPLSDMMEGHLILGYALMPATVFAELALEAATYVLEHIFGVKQSLPCLEIANLQMYSSVFPDPHSPHQAIEIDTLGSPLDPNGCAIQFFSRQIESGQAHQHGSCTVSVVNDAALEKEWSRMRRLVVERIAALKAQPETVLRRPMVYRRFETIVAYSSAYQGIDQATFDASGHEATSTVFLQPTSSSGAFVCSPMLLDSLGQLTGFICNVGIAALGQVFMADGIGRIVTTPHLAKIEPGSLTEITVWARMEPREGIASGDAYFMTSDGQLLGFMQDVVFNQLKRTALERLVSMGAAQMATKASKFLDAPAVKKKSHLSDSALIMPSPSETSSDYSADWVHLAGPTFNAAAGQQPIFLLPDGSGSVGCFAQFLPKSWNVPVLGLNSPFAREGKDKNWTGGISQLAACFFEIIVRIQREGPYVIAGYSLGAMCAVEVARLLAGAGKLVDHLILLECPALNKRNLPPLPPGSLDVLLAKVESAAARRHFERASIAVPGHSFSFDWPEPNQVLVINAADDSLTPNLMTSRPEDWKAVFKLAELKLRVAKGNHQTFLREALKILAQTLA